MSPERTAFISSFGLGTRPHLASFAMGLRNHHGRPDRPTAFRSSREGGEAWSFATDDLRSGLFLVQTSESIATAGSH